MTQPEAARPRSWTFRAMAVRHFERPLVAFPPLVRPKAATGWGAFGAILLLVALLLRCSDVPGL